MQASFSWPQSELSAVPEASAISIPETIVDASIEELLRQAQHNSAVQLEEAASAAELAAPPPQVQTAAASCVEDASLACCAASQVHLDS